MRQVRLGELLQRRRKEMNLSLREMARRCELDPSGLLRIEAGTTSTPGAETLTALSHGYTLARDVLALAAYGEYFEPVPEDPGADAGPFESPPPPDSNSEACTPPRTKRRTLSGATS